MAGAPKRRARREEAARAGVPRAGVSDPASRRWALQRAAVIGDDAAAKEARVSRGTIRSWRARAKAEGGQISAPAVSGAPAVPVPVVVDGEDDLAVAEAELAASRAARKESLERSRELQRLGNDVAAANAARACRDHANAARALASEVAILRESEVRVSAAEGARLIEVLDGWAGLSGLPWGATAAPRRLLGEMLRRAGSGEGVSDAEVERLAETARGGLTRAYAAQLAAAVPAVLDGEDDEVLDPLDVVPVGEGVGRELARSVSSSGQPSPPDAEPEPLTLCAPSSVPSAFRGRFALTDDGAERARVAWSERLRDKAREDAERAAEAEAVTVSAPRRVSSGPLPQGWDSPGGRGRGPAGERAGG